MRLYIVSCFLYFFPFPSTTFGQQPQVGPKVWLTVSSLAEKIRINGVKHISQRKIEMNWMNLPIIEDDMIDPSLTSSPIVKNTLQPKKSRNSLWVALFDRDPKEANSDDALVSLQPKILSRGRFRTDIEFPIYTFSPSNLTTNCLGFWIAVFDSQEILAKNCLRAYPFWMEESIKFLKDRAMKDIMIPGTHNAGSFEVGYKLEPRAILKKYVTCQDESVFNQLAYGIRYLDIRVSFENVISHPKDTLWIVHGILRTEVTLEEVLRQIREFLDATTAEVVILDFHRFEKGFEDHPRDMQSNLATKHRHHQVYQMIEDILGEHISRDYHGFNVKYGDLLREGKRLIVGYAGNRFIREANYYPRVRHLWAEADNTSTLEEYFNRMMCVVSGFEATSAMAQLTPTTWGVIFDKYGGLRKMAQDVNWLITQWFEEKWWPCVNIVATDFFLGNNIVSISIEANKRRPPIPIRRHRRDVHQRRRQSAKDDPKFIVDEEASDHNIWA